MKKPYPTIKDGELVTPKRIGYKMSCCDCGLVHRIDFTTTPKGRIQFKAYRDIKATNKLRKQRGIIK